MKKSVWKILYIVLVLACVLCIAVLLLFLKKDRQEELAAEQQQEEIMEEFTQNVTPEAEMAETPELAELPIDFEGLWEINP